MTGEQILAPAVSAAGTGVGGVISYSRYLATGRRFAKKAGLHPIPLPVERAAVPGSGHRTRWERLAASARVRPPPAWRSRRP